MPQYYQVTFIFAYNFNIPQNCKGSLNGVYTPKANFNDKYCVKVSKGEPHLVTTVSPKSPNSSKTSTA